MYWSNAAREGRGARADGNAWENGNKARKACAAMAGGNARERKQ